MELLVADMNLSDPRVLGTLMGCGIPIIFIISYFWYRTSKVTSENALKRSLVERGLTAEEIERVIRAK